MIRWKGVNYNVGKYILDLPNALVEQKKKYLIANKDVENSLLMEDFLLACDSKDKLIFLGWMKELRIKI